VTRSYTEGFRPTQKVSPTIQWVWRRVVSQTSGGNASRGFASNAREQNCLRPSEQSEVFGGVPLGRKRVLCGDGREEGMGSSPESQGDAHVEETAVEEAAAATTSD
jgi:hypothetical protein